MNKFKILFVFLLATFSVTIGDKTLALSGKTYMDKAYLEGVYTCWMENLKDGPINTGDFPVFPNYLQPGIFKDNNENVVQMPTDLTSSKNTLSCAQLISGYTSTSAGNFQGLLAMSGITQPISTSSDKEKTQFMKNIGYIVEETTNEDGRCVSFNFKGGYNGNDASRSGTLCLMNLKDNNIITDETKVKLSDDANGSQFSIKDSINFNEIDNGNGVELSYVWNHQNCRQTNIGMTCNGYLEENVSETFLVSNYETIDEFTIAIWELFEKKPPSICGGAYQRTCFEYEVVMSDPYNHSSADDTLVQYVIENKETAANEAIKYFSGSKDLNNWNSLKYTDGEMAHLYQDYLNKAFEVSFAVDLCPKVDYSQTTLLDESYIAAGYTKVKWNFDDGARTCYIISEKNANKEVIGIETEGDKKGHFGKKMNFQDLINALNSTILAEDEFSDTAGNNNSDYEPEATCMNSGGAGSLGWIVCPVLDFMSSSAEGIYNNVLKPNLQVESGYFDQDKTEKAWRIFQNIANTLFVVLVLAVIFSQLTGIGIDNYGIKKILPKLIVVAILINLSYLICVICVDLSNIIGNGLQNIFSAFNFDNTTIPTSNGNGGIDISGGAITALVILGGIVGVYAIYNNPALLITLLISALGVLVAVLFLFVLLAGRKAVIVILTILSPVVFMLYMLPNTKKLFDKWLKLWETMLLLYPVCGLLIGGGNFMSKLLLNVSAGDDAFKALTAMAIGILPIFFIPTMLKSAFAAIGTIGSSITGFGNRLRSGATGRLRNSERVKNAQERGQARQKRVATQRRAGVYVDRNGNIQERRRPSARLRRRLSGTGVGRFLGMDRAIGQSTAAYLQQEAARRKDMDNANLDIARAEFQESENARLERQQKGIVGVPVVDQALAKQRAMSRRQSQEFKNYTDQYSSLTRNAMGEELKKAIDAYRGDKSQENTVRLRAAIATADSRKMSNELLGLLGRSGADELKLTGSNSSDLLILDQMAGSSNKVVNQFAKARIKNSNTSMSLHGFMDGGGQNDNLADVFNSKGSEVMNGMDDDTLSYIRNSRMGAAINTETIFNAAMQTSDAKELAQLNEMLRNRRGYTMKTSDFANIKLDTLRSLDSSVWNAAYLELQNGSESSRQIIGKMDQAVRDELRRMGATGGI